MTPNLQLLDEVGIGFTGLKLFLLLETLPGELVQRACKYLFLQF